MENIDDECDQQGIIFVKVILPSITIDFLKYFWKTQIGDEKKAASLGITALPALVYYEDNIPNIYKGDLRIERDVLDWLIEQLNNAEIEEVTDEILDKLIEKHQTLIAVFCKKTSNG